MATAAMEVGIRGVQIDLKNGEVLNGYILSESPFLNSCNKSEENIKKWVSYLKDKFDGEAVMFMGKLVRIKKQKYDPELFAVKSSMKKIKIDDIKSIKGICRKWSDTWVSAYFSFPVISDFMAEYVTNHQMIAAYTFDHEDVPDDDADYAYSTLTTYFSYNPEYPRKRLIKEKKIIDKMSNDVLDKNKLIRLRWATD